MKELVELTEQNLQLLRRCKLTIKELKSIINYIKSVSEYMHDGVDEEIIDMLKEVIKKIEKNK